MDVVTIAQPFFAGEKLGEICGKYAENCGKLRKIGNENKKKNVNK